MDTLLDKLTKLAQLDIDAIGAYKTAIAKIDDATIQQKLTQFKGDHERHVIDLNREIVTMDGAPLEEKPDLKGLLIKGLTALQSAFGTESALKAMKGNEELTNKTYDEALADNNLPVHIRFLLEKNRDDERLHLQYIEQQLSIMKAHA